jgi:hypothetical protein
MGLTLAIMIFMGIVGILFLIAVGVLKISEAILWLIYGD